MQPVDHMFIDIETSHLDTDVAEVLDFAAIRTDGNGAILHSYQSLVKPEKQVHPDAARINGYSPEGWKNAPTLDSVVNEFHKQLIQPYDDRAFVTVAYFGDGFDRPILKRAIPGFERIFGPKAWVDVGQLAWPFLYSGMIDSRKLSAVSKFFEVENPAPHSASADVFTLVQVYWLMMKRYRFSLAGEKYLREVGGDGLKTIRDLFGL